jgi:multidrug efflux pump subunit AcrB
MKGLVGRFFLQFALTVVFAVLVSLFVSFTLTPMLASRFLRRHGSPPTGHGHSSGEASPSTSVTSRLAAVRVFADR